MIFIMGVGEMALHNILNNIATLASLEYQERYVIGGTADEYIVIDDLLEDYSSSVYWANHRSNRAKFREDHLVAINQYYDFLLQVWDNAVDARSHAEVAPLMRDQPVWAEIRRRAADTLDKLGISIEHVAIEQLDEHEWDYPPTTDCK